MKMVCTAVWPLPTLFDSENGGTNKVSSTRLGTA